MENVSNKTRIVAYIALVITGIIFLWSLLSSISSIFNIITNLFIFRIFLSRIFELFRTVIIYAVIIILNIMLLKKKDNKLAFRLLFAFAIAFIFTESMGRLSVFINNLFSKSVWEMRLITLLISQFIQLALSATLLAICIYQAYIYFKEYDKIGKNNYE